MSRVTITRAVPELRSARRLRTVASGRVRSPGGGRKKVEAADPNLSRKLRGIVEETTAGDPMSPLKWTSQSTRTIAEELTCAGHAISSVTVGRCLATKLAELPLPGQQPQRIANLGAQTPREVGGAGLRFEPVRRRREV